MRMPHFMHPANALFQLMYTSPKNEGRRIFCKEVKMHHNNKWAAKPARGPLLIIVQRLPSPQWMTLSPETQQVIMCWCPQPDRSSSRGLTWLGGHIAYGNHCPFQLFLRLWAPITTFSEPLKFCQGFGRSKKCTYSTTCELTKPYLLHVQKLITDSEFKIGHPCSRQEDRTHALKHWWGANGGDEQIQMARREHTDLGHYVSSKGTHKRSNTDECGGRNLPIRSVFTPMLS